MKLALDEPETDAVASELSRHDLVSSQLLVAEAHRAVARVAEPDRLTRLTEELEGVDLFEVTAGILETAGRLPSTSLRTLDAIHLATAMRIPRIDVFVSHDVRLLEAAAGVGFRVVDPR